MPEKSIKKNAVLNIIKSLVGIAYPLITFPYASRVLNPDGIGQINFVNGIVDFFIILCSLGIPSYAIRECSKIRNDKILLTKQVQEIMIINFISMFLSIFIYIILLSTVKKMIDLRILFLIIGSKLFFETIGINWFCTVVEDYTYITIRSILLQFISVIFLFIFVKKPSDLIKYAFMGIIYSVGSNIINLFYVRRYINLFAKNKFEFKKHLKPIFTFFAVAISSKLYSILDSTMLGFFSTDESVGYYSAANKLINILLTLLIAGYSVALPRASKYYHNNEKEKFTTLVKKSINYTNFFSIPATVGVFLLCKPFILLLCGHKYLPAILPMKVLTPIIIFSALSFQIQYIILIPTNKEKTILISQYIGSGINILVNYFLIIKFQCLGAIIASLISQICIFFYQFFPVRHYFFNKEIIINLLKNILQSSIMFAVCFYIGKSIKDSGLTIILSVLFGALTYAISSILLRNSVSKEIIEYLRSKCINER